MLYFGFFIAVAFFITGFFPFGDGVATTFFGATGFFIAAVFVTTGFTFATGFFSGFARSFGYVKN